MLFLRKNWPYGRSGRWRSIPAIWSGYTISPTINGYSFIVREHLPLSLNDLLAAGGNMPISLAVRLAYQVLEALGGPASPHGCRRQNTEPVPSRPASLQGPPAQGQTLYSSCITAASGKLIEKANPAMTNLKEMPLAHLAYKAPEQFRTYLARKRPPVFTDIYLFGVLFYEMLTGAPAFKASSFGEYEIQHCEQYPSPPKVWRPEIPETLNELIMNCLTCDPMKRFRSTTQISLILEKSFPKRGRPPQRRLVPKVPRKIKMNK